MIKHMVEDPTGFSLADQMRIDEFEVSRRKELLQFEQEDIDLLVNLNPVRTPETMTKELLVEPLLLAEV